MPTLYDARGNEWRGNLDGVNGDVVTDARTLINTLSAANAEVVIDLNGHNRCIFDIRTAAMNATLVFEGSVDGTNYYQIHGMNGTTEAQAQNVVITTTHTNFYVVACTGFRRMRCRVSAYTSGNCTVSGRASVGQYDVYSRPMPSLNWVTATAAANTSNTATLAGVAGTFHYITSIHLARNATAALAGTATLVITSTNLPGGPAWSVGNAMVAGGSQTDLSIQFANPLKSSVAGTSTTIVYPACGLAVLSRINVSYYHCG